MKEFCHIVVIAAKINAVVSTGFRFCLERQDCCALPGEVDLQRVKEKKDIAGEQQHPLPDTARYAGHGYHELIKESGRPTVREDAGDRGEQLAESRVLGDTLAVAAGVNDEGTQVFEVFRMRFRCKVAQNAKGGSPAANPFSFRVGENAELSTFGEETGCTTLLRLFAETFGLVFVRRSEDDVVPADEGFVV